MTSTTPVFSFEPFESAIQLCGGFPEQKQQQRVFVAYKRRAPNTDECWCFRFPGVSDEVATIYHDSLLAMDRWCPIPDFFTQPEVNLIVKNIDNKDYVDKVYPGQNVGWHGLMNDTGIFRAVARFKKQTDNPKLFAMLWVCSALDTPMPKHIYYLFFKSADGVTLKMSYCSGDEILRDTEGTLL